MIAEARRRPPTRGADRAAVAEAVDEIARLDGTIDADDAARWTAGGAFPEIRGLLGAVAEDPLEQLDRAVRQGRRGRLSCTLPEVPAEQGLSWEDFERARPHLEQRASPAWLAGLRTSPEQPRNAGKKEFFQQIVEPDLVEQIEPDETPPRALSA